MTDNIDLYMFYFSQFLTNNIFYIKEEDTYVVAEVEENTLTIHAIFGNTDIEKVILSFGKTIKKVILGFTPNNVKGYKKEQLIEEDTTLFVKGKFFADDAKRTLIFPQITRA